MHPTLPERVLCSPTEELPKAWRPDFGAVPITESQLQETLVSLAPVWLPRSQAETDPEFLQWIPYALLLDPQDRIAAYPRKGSETRLHGVWSLGVGGHVNPVDGPASTADRARLHDWPALLRNGLRRELHEEYPGLAPRSIDFLGLIHESRTPVGRVHLGAVFRVAVPGDPGTPGPELDGLRWLSPQSLGGTEWPEARFESWSILALRLLDPR